MNNPQIIVKNAPFKRFCMSIGAIPTSYLDSLDYYETLLWLIKYLEETIIPTVNNNGEAVSELQTLYIQLKDFVENYFDNLDVQEEINNKLDEMVEDGTLAEIINQEIFGEIQEEINKNKKYKSNVIMICMKETTSGNCFVIEFANGKNMFIDTGHSTDWEHIVYVLNELNINYFDYGVITHPHSDHVGNLQNFISNYCDENTIFYVGATPDFTKIPNEQSSYENMYAIFTLNNITPIVPTNNSVITIDELSKTSIRFLNTNTDWFEDYYDVLGEYRTDEQTANVFSLVTEITFDNVKFLETGDIEKCVEDKLVNYVNKVNLMTPPHHFSNKHINESFYNNTDADSYFISTNNGSLSYSNAGYIKAIRENKNIISSYQAQFNYVIATTYGYNFKYDKSNYKGLYIPKLFNNIANLITSEHYIANSSDISLSTILSSMNLGDVLNFILYSDFTTLKSDLLSVFGIANITNESIIEIKKSGGTMYNITLQPKDKRISLTAHTNNSGTNWYVLGSGSVGSWTNETQLLNIINDLPVGVYSLYYNGNSEHTLGATPQYQTLNINQITGTGYRKGYIEGVRNNTSFAGFIGNFTGASGGFAWKQITLT